MATFLAKAKGFLITAALLLVLGAVGAHFVEANRKGDLATATAELKVARDSLRLAVAKAAVRDSVIASETRRADSAGAQATRTAAQAAVSRVNVKTLEVKLDNALKDSSAIEDAKVLFDAMDAYADSLNSELTLKTEQVVDLTAALDSAKKSVVEVSHAAFQEDTAATKVVAASRPGFFVRIMPKAGLGAAVGIDQTGHPAVVVGFTLSWPR